MIYLFDPTSKPSGYKSSTETRNEAIKTRLSGLEFKDYNENNDGKPESIDCKGNIIIAHFTDCKEFSVFFEISNATIIYHTYNWEGEFLVNPDVKELHNGYNKFCVGSEMVIKNIRPFIDALIKNENNPYHILIDYDSQFEEFLKIYENKSPFI